MITESKLKSDCTPEIIIVVNSPQYGIKLVKIDSEDYERVSKYKWYVRLEKTTGRFYVLSHNYTNGDTTIYLHRLLLNCPKGKIVDHIDHDTLNNKKSNLRICTRTENIRNSIKRKDYKYSEYKGVKWHEKDKRFHSRITFNGKRFYLGGFITEIEAAIAYNKKAVEFYGEFACLNIIN
jgi:hypothetical protein